jgi:uncharacterized protein DUF2334
LTDAARNERLLGAPLRTKAVPPLPVRVAQRVAMKAGLLGYKRGLAPGGSGAPRFLVRVDEFPHYLAADEPGRFGIAASRTFHGTLATAGVPYLMAILPRVATHPLDPSATGDRPLSGEEIAFLGQMGSERVTFGLHGYNHRTRYERPQRHSELCGLPERELSALLDRALGELEKAGVRPRVFVPPYNRFDAAQYPLLAERFDVVCGGPESVPLMGFHPGPQWRGDAVYLPCYPPLYGTADECRPVIAELVERQVGTWVPIVLHPGWEAKTPDTLRAFADEIAPYAASWDDFLNAVEASR